MDERDPNGGSNNGNPPPPGGFGSSPSAPGGAPHGVYKPPQEQAPSSYQPPGEPALGYAYSPENRHRGGCLTAFLVLMLIANPLTAIFYIVGADFVKKGMPSAPDWALPVLSVAALVNSVCAVGIWLWRKWGVYGVVAMAALALVVNFAIGIPPMNAVMGLAGPIILIFLVRPLWRGFR